MDRTLQRLAALTRASDVETRCAALVVVTALGCAEEPMVQAVAGALGAGNVVVRDFALSYFERLRPAGGLPLLVPLLDSEDETVRLRAAAVVADYGGAAIAAMRKLRAEGPRRRLHAIIDVCGRVRSAAAYDLLFRIMAEGDFDANRLAGEAVEAGIRGLDGAGRRQFFARVDAFATAVKEHRVALVSALRLFGALGDPRCRRRLFPLLRSEHPHAVRTHALGALVRCLRGATLSAAEIAALLALLDEEDEAGIVRPAISLIEEQQLGRAYLAQLQRLAESPRAVVKRFAVHALAGFDSGAVIKTLIGYLTDASFARRNEAAAGLKRRPEARQAVLKELLASDDERPAWTLADILLAHDRNWRAEVRGQLWARCVSAFEGRGDRLYSPFLHVLRQLDEPEALARVRDRGETLRRKKQYGLAARWLGLLRETPAFDDEVQFAMAVAEVSSRKRVLPGTVRRHDAALELLHQLAGGAFPLGARLRKERALTPDALLYIGFHLAEGTEADRAAAREVLAHLAARSGRTRAGKAAKNKLRLLG